MKTLLVLLVLISVASASAPNVVAVIFRHGHRTPEGSYPRDPHRDFKWEAGYGGLTEKGVTQIYELGKRIRSRYPHFASLRSFSPDKMLLRSSSKHRAIMSGQAFMAGFLPPPENYSLPIRWQPSGLVSLSNEEDAFINFQKNCPRYQRELTELTKNPPPYVQEFLNERPDILRKIGENTGLEVDNVLTGWYLFNVLRSQEENGLALSKSAKEILKSYRDFPPLGFRLLAHSETMRRVKGGALLNDLAQQLRESRPLVVYSGHDLTIMHLFHALGVSLETMPGYGAAVLWEYYSDSETHRLFYANDFSDKVTRIELPDGNPFSGLSDESLDEFCE